eukprot:CAMPEP_0171111922 /NCGR_PEP_ID=MMETSP0766_2-20121228/77180_1 /TAXON_ID=439317 /ORGANISM="Gambierdiscus australes, Strain CAWD 149" /LENGTH=139 /DNA_ID=CAMNT_0011573977 /DNA_START=45 /DNA_END=460 /DNA_ORIENTATION=-
MWGGTLQDPDVPHDVRLPVRHAPEAPQPVAVEHTAPIHLLPHGLPSLHSVLLPAIFALKTRFGQANQPQARRSPGCSVQGLCLLSCKFLLVLLRSCGDNDGCHGVPLAVLKVLPLLDVLWRPAAVMLCRRNDAAVERYA